MFGIFFLLYIPALWKRMTDVEYPLLLNNNLKELVWKIICQNKNFNFYELPERRGELKIFNHLQHFDSEGVFLEMVCFYTLCLDTKS